MKNKANTTNLLLIKYLNMKKIEKLKLNQLSKDELKKRELNHIKGGSDECCKCCCGYSGEPGGSSTKDNWSANQALGHKGSYGTFCGCGSSMPVPEGECPPE